MNLETKRCLDAVAVPGKPGPVSMRQCNDGGHQMAYLSQDGQLHFTYQILVDHYICGNHDGTFGTEFPHRRPCEGSTPHWTYIEKVNEVISAGGYVYQSKGNNLTLYSTSSCSTTCLRWKRG